MDGNGHGMVITRAAVARSALNSSRAISEPQQFLHQFSWSWRGVPSCNSESVRIHRRLQVHSIKLRRRWMSADVAERSHKTAPTPNGFRPGSLDSGRLMDWMLTGDRLLRLTGRPLGASPLIPDYFFLPKALSTAFMTDTLKFFSSEQKFFTLLTLSCMAPGSMSRLLRFAL